MCMYIVYVCTWTYIENICYMHNLTKILLCMLCGAGYAMHVHVHICMYIVHAYVYKNAGGWRLVSLSATVG